MFGVDSFDWGKRRGGDFRFFLLVLRDLCPKSKTDYRKEETEPY